MANDGAVVQELVAKLGIEPDAPSFAAADKMLEGVAAVAAQLVAAVQAITVRLDVMAAHAATAGAALQTALAPKAPTIPTPTAPRDEIPTDPVEAAKQRIVAEQEAKRVREQAMAELGLVHFGPALPPGFKPAGPTRDEQLAAAKERILAAQKSKEIEAQARKELGMVEPELSGIARAARLAGAALAGTFVVNQIKGFAMSLVNASGAIIGTSERLGLSKQAVQEWGFAAKIAEADIGALETAFKFLQQNSAQAAKGSKTDAEAFRKLGIDIKDASGNVKSADVLFEEAADAISKLPTNAEKTAAAMQLFGRSGAQLLPMLKLGSAGIRELREEARALGGGLSDQVIEEADEFEDSLTRLDFAMLGLKSTIGNLLLPTLTTFVEWTTRGVAAVKKFWQETKYLQTIMIGALTYIAVTNARVVAGFIARWAVAAAPFLAIAAAIAVVALALEDVYQTLTGGRGLLGKWLDEWKGAGYTASLVRDLAAGYAILAESLTSVGGAWKLAKEAIKGIQESFSGSPESQREFLATRVSNLKRWGKSPQEIAAAERELADFDRKNPRATQSQPWNIDRAIGRGLSAAVLRQEIGRGDMGVNSVNRGATVNNVNVTVNAQTNADPKQIAAEAKKATQEALRSRNQKLREAFNGVY